MTIIGFHASHEQIHPATLLRAVQRAEEVGFAAAMCSDHFAPWSPRQGHSGFAWSWLGAALASTSLSFGVVNAPGQRYHPAIVAQAAATLEAMFPGRFWVALGSGEAMNEHITGDPWPSKDARDDRLRASVDVMQALLAGDEVSRSGAIRVDRARLWTLPDAPPPLIAAAVGPETAARSAEWADGLVTVAQPPERLREVVAAYRDAGGRGPISLQLHLSWAGTEQEALAVAFEQWRNSLVPPHVSWDIDDPADFDRYTADARPDDIRGPVFVSSDLGAHAARIAELAAIGFDRVYLHHVGVEQDAFLDAFGERVLPQFTEVAP